MYVQQSRIGKEPPSVVPWLVALKQTLSYGNSKSETHAALEYFWQESCLVAQVVWYVEDWNTNEVSRYFLR